MKIFLDSADVEVIRKAHATGLVDGVTTNPSKLAHTGKPFTEVVKEICAIVPGPVSVEAVADMADDLLIQGATVPLGSQTMGGANG